MSGAGKWQRATSSSSAMLTILWWVSSTETNAERFLEEFKERLAKFGLELHPEKTRLIEFGRFAAHKRKQRGKGNRRPSRSWGSPTTVGSAQRWTFIVWRITAKKRMVAKLKAVKVELQRRKHDRTARSVHGFGRWYWLLPIPCCPRKHDQLRTFRQRINGSGGTFWFVVANAQRRVGTLTPSSTGGYPYPESCIPIPTPASTPPILHKSRMRRRAHTDPCGVVP